MKLARTFAIASLVCAAALPAACGKKAGEGIAWLSSMDEGKERAEAEDKNLVVYYSADWSKLSEQFEYDVLENADVQKKLADFVAVHIDSDVDEDTPKTYAVGAYPTTIFYTSEGEEITRAVGAVTAEEFSKLVDDVVAGRVETVRELLAREEANPDDYKLAYEVGTMYMETGRYEKARPRFEKIVAQDPENETGLAPGALTQIGFTDLTAQRADDAVAIFAEVVEKYPDAPETPKCYVYMGDAYHLLDDVEDAAAAYRKVVADYPDTPEADEAQKKLGELTMFEDTVEAFTQGPEARETE
ncbi:MAG: tetratricopeptide repeat protein [bacterium]